MSTGRTARSTPLPAEPLPQLVRAASRITGVKFAVLGPGEARTGDPARRYTVGEASPRETTSPSSSREINREASSR
jgi:hypothetical protein